MEPVVDERRLRFCATVFSSDSEPDPPSFVVVEWTGLTWRPLGTYASADEARASSAYLRGKRQRELRVSRSGMTYRSAIWELESGWVGLTVLSAACTGAVLLLR